VTPPLHSRGGWRFLVGWGRVYEIVGFSQLLWVNPPLHSRGRWRFTVGWGGFTRLSVLGNYGSDKIDPP